ncbi:hypothetical protein JXQ70_13960 [bacterium]|nr:hypothetical protein [bacterium]
MKHSNKLLRIMTVMSLIIFLSCIDLVPRVWTEGSLPVLVEQALRTMQTGSTIDWSFTLITTSAGTKTIEHCDQTRPEGEQWQLVLIEDRKPTPEELEKYREAKNKLQNNDQAKKKDEDEENVSISIELGKLFGSGSLLLLEEEAERVKYGFQPSAQKEDDQKLMKHLKGTCLINRTDQASPYIEEITMFSENPFSPMFSVKIETFRTTMRFRPIEPGGPVLPARVTSFIQGKAFFIKTIAEDITVDYSDYVRCEDSPESNGTSN